MCKSFQPQNDQHNSVDIFKSSTMCVVTDRSKESIPDNFMFMSQTHFPNVPTIA